ncbi:hypothetical protein SDC9_07789 [bioreactor metagenome]|uniref:DUF4367 domain-containing protein n=1 Tax=bioreactor metagenome TaxID=1076179 RepID=A0A644T5H5_9ZZZZ
MLELSLYKRKYRKYMKKIDFKSKKTLWWIIGLLALLLIGFLVYRGLEGKSLKIWNGNSEKLVDIANSDDYAKFEGKQSVNFEGENTLNFSFLYKKDGEAVQGVGSQSNWFKLFDAEKDNFVTLYTTFEGGRGYTAEDYINEVFKKANPDVVIEDIKFAGNSDVVVKHIIDDTINTEYYIQEVKATDESPWLAIVENKKADNEAFKTAAKDLIRSFEVK